MSSKIVGQILEKAASVARTRKNIFLIGEYGSGKSWLAKKIHNLSTRSTNPFFRINCYTMQEEEIKKRVFGHLTFTEMGARIDRGLLERCQGGTILLEGFDSISHRLQVQLMQSVNENRSSHYGSKRTVPINVRIIGSMNVEAFHSAQKKYNLIDSVIPDEHYSIFYPPLRHRREDIADLINTFLKDEFSHQYEFASQNISPSAVYLCIRHDWPGNVRQLKNAIQHAAVISVDDEIQPKHLPKSITQGQPSKKKIDYLEHTYSYKTAEKKLFSDVLKKTKSETEAYKLLDIKPAVFKEKIKQYQLLNHFSGEGHLNT